MHALASGSVAGERYPPAAAVAAPALTVIRVKYDEADEGALRAVRAELAKHLDGHHRLDDALLVATELATNSLLHARRRRRTFRIELEATEASVYIAVIDDGAPAKANAHAGFSEVLKPDGQRENGRGLFIVEALAQRCGDNGGGRRWAELASWM